ncbi:NAD-dependent epimerase/dehydratase family protein [Daejeonella sp.]|uniref:NAD-dependent epimerase/dehydratase family protein n=1 Tax=Daejeonella sp. TaxID=2805397 RepID=UPI0025BF739C|nr:NAD-dependent epimerase/dehydratase family protein [Daejeonella sp.]
MILLTGSNGFLGCQIQNVLNTTQSCITLSRSNSNINCDISNFIPVLPQLNIVIHTAGKAHSVPQTSLEKQAFFDVNFKGTQNLLQGLEESQSLPKAFIFISSVAVYGRENGINISEDAPLLAKDPYGLSKIRAEQLVIEWCKKYNVICTILRLPLLAGANPPGNLGAMIKGIKRGYYFNIAGGRAQKSMVLASDVAQCILKVSEIGGIYNLTDGYHPTFNELSRTISLQFGRKFVPNMPLFFAKILAKIGDLIGDKFPVNSNKLSKIMAPLTFDDSKARKAFGWNPTPVLKGFKIEENA